MINGLPLREFEFTPSADEAAYHFDSSRRKAAAQLLSSVYQGDGLFFLTGETGIGKSTLLCHLHRQMAGLDGVVLLSPSEPLPCQRAMTLAQLLEACETSLQLGPGTADPLKLARRLQRLSEDGCVPVLLADDADLLDTAALDALATLAGLRAGQQRLLSAVLAGTPALPARLTLPRGDDGMPEGHRVVALPPLSDGAVARLLQRRLAKPFEPDAALAIAHVSGGVPAQVIEIGERALQLASRRSSAVVTGDIAAAALRRDPAPGEPSPGEVMSGRPTSSFEPHPAVVASFAADATSRIAADGTSALTADGKSRIAFDEASPVVTPFAAVRPSAESTVSKPIFPEPTLRTPTSADSQFPPSSLFPQTGTVPQTGTFPETDESPFTMPPLDSPTGVRTTQRLTPTRRKGAKGGAGIGAKLAIVGGVCFAILLAVASALYLNDEPADGTLDRSSLEAPSPTTSAPSSATDRSATGMSPFATDDGASSTETGPAGGGWRPPSWEEQSPPSGEPDAANLTTAEPETPQPASVARAPLPSVATRQTPDSASPSDAESDAPPSPAVAPVVAPAAPPAVLPPPPATARPTPTPAAAQPATPEPETAPEIAKLETPPLKSGTAAPTTTAPKPAAPKATAPTAASSSATASATPSPVATARSPSSSAVEAASAARSTPAEPSPATGQVLPSRQRQIAVLLNDGDARLQEGDIEAARTSYQNAFERGSGEAARRLAETFDPRSHTPASRQASPEEAILWYQDAVRRGDRRAAYELQELATWLENSAASGNREARRVLDAWRTPAEPETGAEAASTP